MARNTINIWGAPSGTLVRKARGFVGEKQARFLKRKALRQPLQIPVLVSLPRVCRRCHKQCQSPSAPQLEGGRPKAPPASNASSLQNITGREKKGCLRKLPAEAKLTPRNARGTRHTTKPSNRGNRHRIMSTLMLKRQLKLPPKKAEIKTCQRRVCSDT